VGIKGANSRRPILTRGQIELRAAAFAYCFDSHAFEHQSSPIYLIAKGLIERCNVPIHFRQNLGCGPKGGTVLGRFDFSPARILIDASLTEDSPRFRWTLCHEIGHYALHRTIDLRRISRRDSLVDTRIELFRTRTAGWSDAHWIEWQANKFAAALLLPKPILNRALLTIQNDLAIPRCGQIYVDDQPQNLRDFRTIMAYLASRLGALKSMILYRLSDLGLLTDARTATRTSGQHVLALRAIVSSALNRELSARNR